MHDTNLFLYIQYFAQKYLDIFFKDNHSWNCLTYIRRFHAASFNMRILIQK